MLMSSGLGKPFGHPVYHPIYEAAHELGLPIALHIGGEAAPQQGISPLAGGMPSFYSEIIAHTPQSMMTHLASLILHGVFEKFPGLRVLALETRPRLGPLVPLESRHRLQGPPAGDAVAQAAAQ